MAGEQLDVEPLPLQVLCRRMQDGKIQSRSLGEHYQSFFPDVMPSEASTYDYPGVDRDRFWRAYAEPARRFIEAGRYLAAPLEGLARMNAGELSSNELPQVQEALEAIGAMASAVDLAGSVTDGAELSVGWWTPARRTRPAGSSPEHRGRTCLSA